jgi:hypothetical protein
MCCIESIDSLGAVFRILDEAVNMDSVRMTDFGGEYELEIAGS